MNRTNMEVELIKTGDLFFKVVDDSPVGMILIELETAKFEYVNKSFLNYFGYTKEEVLGKTSAELKIVYPEFRERILSELDKNDIVNNIEIIVRKKSGEPFWSLASFQKITVNNKKYTLTSFIDLTEQKKAEESNKLKEAFLSIISHEIRTPLNAIMGFSNILFKRELGEEENEYLNIIKTSGENLLTIIDDIIDMSKIEAGIMVFEENQFSINEIFQSLIVNLTEKAKENNIELAFYIDKDIPSILLGDQKRLKQVLLNLTDNAIRFTEKGTVNISVRVLENKNENMLLGFSVKDTGMGIPVNHLQHIFERFKQLEPHDKRKHGGVGLGLSIAKQLVELQGGTLTVESELKKGSTFSFSLPFRK